MVKDIILKIEESMSEFLEPFQMKVLHNELINNLIEVDLSKTNYNEVEKKNYLDTFICAKRVEGCSEKSIKYYKSTIEKMLGNIDKEINKISTEDLRGYLGNYLLKVQ